MHQQGHIVQACRQTGRDRHIAAAGKGDLRTELTHETDRLSYPQRDARDRLDRAPGDIARQLAGPHRHHAKARCRDQIYLQAIITAKIEYVRLILIS